MEGLSIEEKLRRIGAALGLDAVGFADAGPTERTAFLREWWARGYGGEMAWIGRRLEERVDPRRVLPGARSLIVVGLALPGGRDGAKAAPQPLQGPQPSRGPQPTQGAQPDPAPSPPPDAPPARGRVARYAGGDDYHDVLGDRLRAFEAALSKAAGRPVRSRSYVDTGPVAERAAAERAGLGWIAKNSCLIHPELGSHLMLGVILSDLPLERDPPVADHCGRCRACLDVCPTDAFPEPYVLDATRCLSYTTIELRGAIPDPLRAAQGDHVFGCDLCQTVCPWNRSRPREPLPDPLGLRTRLAKRSEWAAPTLEWLLAQDEAALRDATRGTALRRSGARGLLRNALVAAGNAGDPRLRASVQRHVEASDPVIAEHARWALERIDAAGSRRPGSSAPTGREGGSRSHRR